MGGYPIWAYFPLLISLAGVWVFTQGLTEMKSRLQASGLGARGGTAMFASETRLKALGVHDSTWKARIGVALETVGVLLFVAAILSVELA
ncbi:MAG: hypothetical protein J0L52_07580 [Caulobacterales bacterium]|nr:hypothetical protein [Caulobacterales bacterium]